LEGDILISEKNNDYFDDLGVVLSQQQKNWYEVKSRQQGDDMTQEFPTKQEEAFQGSMQGAWYTDEFKKLREHKQIMHLPYDARYQVHTWWDLGMNDMMSIWFYQYIEGRHCFIDYHESNLEAWSFYAQMLNEKGYNYAGHHFPHDGKTRRRGLDEIYTDMQMASMAGVNPIDITPVTGSVYSDIRDHCKVILPMCFFDQIKCELGLTHLENYKKKWNKADGMWMKEPLHDEASHCADAFRTFAVNADMFARVKRSDPYKQNYSRGSGWMGN
jgi:hypothetical protein